MTLPVVYSEAFTFAWPGHVFPTGKYRPVARAALERGIAAEFSEPAPATRDEVLTCHDVARRAGAAVVGLLAGGYARREEDVVEIHLQTLETFSARWGGGWKPPTE